MTVETDITDPRGGVPNPAAGKSPADATLGTTRGWTGWAQDGAIAVAIALVGGLTVSAWALWGFEAMLSGLAWFCF